MLIKGLHCTTCRRTQAPKLARPGHIRHTIGQFNELVLADLFYVKDVAAVTHHFMLMIDEGTGFVIIVPCSDHSAANFVDIVETHWLMWAGPPDMLVADGERGFSSDEVARGLGKAGTMYIAAAAYTFSPVNRMGFIQSTSFIEQCAVCPKIYGSIFGRCSSELGPEIPLDRWVSSCSVGSWGSFRFQIWRSNRKWSRNDLIP